LEFGLLDLIRTAFEAGTEFAFQKIAGSAAQIFENLVGREVEVMLTRSGAARKGGGWA
jgi:ribosomal protein S11